MSGCLPEVSPELQAGMAKMTHNFYKYVSNRENKWLIWISVKEIIEKGLIKTINSVYPGPVAFWVVEFAYM